MSITFACPQCKARVEVSDEFAGHAGQCPRCQSVVAIPMGSEPEPTVTVVDEPERADPRPKRRPPESAERRPRPISSTPKGPAGPIWPWFVGFLGALVIAVLLISSVAVLAFSRRADPVAARIAL